MDWLVYILLVIVAFIGGLFVKNLLPSYMDEKGKNIATKEDIQEITKKTEEVQKEFRESFELFSSDVQFKYDLYYKMYANLYTKLYAIIMQSEYVRHFILLTNNENFTFEDEPFIEISPIERTSQEFKFEQGKPATMKQTVENIETPISQFNKKTLCDYIIDNGEFASQDLLKLAVSYRFAYSHYTGNTDVKNSSCQSIANDEEYRLIKEIVFSIVKEYNWLRKELKMPYNDDELNNGVPKL